MIDVLLKNISQVVLISNKWTGLFILIGLFVADWTVGLAAMIGSIIAYALHVTLIIVKQRLMMG